MAGARDSDRIERGRQQQDHVAVVLFTRDLRVHDHPALVAACASADTVVPLFVVDPAIADIPVASANRWAFLCESLADLRASLIRRGADLYVRRGDAVDETMRIMERTGASTLLVTEDASSIARARQQRLERACRRQRHRFELFPGVTVVPPGEMTPEGKDHYAVFTPYWRRWREVPRRRTLPAPGLVCGPRGLAAGRLPGASALRTRPLSPQRPRGGESAGRALVARFLRRDLAQYARADHDMAPDRGSRLSPYLHFGCVSPLELAGRADGSEAFVRQLCWRDFHHQVLAAFPALSTRDYRRRDRHWRDDRRAFDAWRTGRTGVPIVDAGMRQLLAEGFMHNRARMLTAFFLVKELDIDWRWGAHHFRDWLVDADVANNSGNWQWVAGTGNDTRPNRRYNLIRQARRHDPDGTYVRRYVRELAAVEGGAVHEPWCLPRASRARLEYPDPLGGVPGGRR
jgi:deoxyribodipyrimidine photo-lyase